MQGRESTSERLTMLSVEGQGFRCMGSEGGRPRPFVWVSLKAGGSAFPQGDVMSASDRPSFCVAFIQPRQALCEMCPRLADDQ